MGWESAWIAPNPFWKAVAPISAALSIFVLASIFSPFSYASKRLSFTNFIPIKAIPSAIGWYPGEQYASRQWAKASIPVPAVNFWGSLKLKVGSQITLFGSISGWKITFLILLMLSVKTPALPTSEPVPAVVGIAIIGNIPSVFALFQLSLKSSNSQTGRSWAIIKANNFPKSKADPPPNAITPSKLPSFNISRPWRRFISVGFESTWLNTEWGNFKEINSFFKLVVISLSPRFLSVTTNGLKIFKSLQHCPISFNLPEPILICVGKFQLAFKDIFKTPNYKSDNYNFYLL